MSNHLREDRIQDYVDDLLCHEERLDAEQHLLICAVCQAEVAALGDLVTDINAMPLGIAPERDLLAGINARIDAADVRKHAGAVPSADSTHTATRLRDRSLWSLRIPLAAAAFALIAISASLALLLSRNAARNGGDSNSVARGNLRGPVVNASQTSGRNTLDQRYAAATGELEMLLRAQRTQLAPETQRLVEENLRVIDHALAEARDALRSDPSNAALADLMRSAYEKKLDLLRHATQLRGDS